MSKEVNKFYVEQKRKTKKMIIAGVATGAALIFGGWLPALAVGAAQYAVNSLI
jgi:hypothetical protein